MSEKQKVLFVTADGSKWQMDEAWVSEQFADDHERDPDDMVDYLADVFHQNSYEDWLYPNAKLIEPSGTVSAVFDGVADDVTTPYDDDETDSNPYQNGWKFGEFTVE